MHAGQLDRRIVLQRALSPVDDGYTSAPAGGFGTLATVWASKTDLSVAEVLRAAQLGATVSTKFQIRWSSAWADLSAKDRIFETATGLTFAIVGVVEIQRRQGLLITACAQADIPAGTPAP
jgi:head-tail adaptor